MLSKVNIKESLQFLVICRETLANIVEQSSISELEKETTKNFLFNEASDYQILSLIVTEELPDEKYNQVGEAILFNELQEQILESYGVISELFHPDFMANFVCEIGSVYPGSSAKPVLEYLSRTNQQIVLELNPDHPGYQFVRGIKGIYKAVKNFSPADYALKAWTAAGGDIKKAAAIVQKKAASVGSNIQKGTSLDIAKMRKAGMAKFTGAHDAMADKARMAPAKGIGVKLQRGVERGKELAGKGVEAISKKMDALMGSIKTKYPEAEAAARAAVTKAKEFAGTDKGKVIGAVALATLIAFASYKVYKAKFSAAAKACKNAKGAEKKACLKKYKIDAIKAQAANMKKASAYCAQTKNPAKCKAALAGKIKKLQLKAQKKSA